MTSLQWSQLQALLDSPLQGDLEEGGNQDASSLPFICLGEVLVWLPLSGAWIFEQFLIYSLSSSVLLSQTVQGWVPGTLPAVKEMGAYSSLVSM